MTASFPPSTSRIFFFYLDLEFFFEFLDHFLSGFADLFDRFDGIGHFDRLDVVFGLSTAQLALHGLHHLFKRGLFNGRDRDKHDEEDHEQRHQVGKVVTQPGTVLGGVSSMAGSSGACSSPFSLETRFFCFFRAFFLTATLIPKDGKDGLDDPANRVWLKRRERPKKAGKKEEAAEAPPPEMPDIDAPAKKGAPKWVVTFSDLMSLLMCFFIMLLSMSEIDIKKFKAMLEGLDAGLDIKRSALVVRKASQSVEAQQTLRARKQTVADTIKLMRLLKPLIQAKQIELLVREKKIVIRVLQGSSFKAGSEQLKKAFVPVARKLRDVFAEIEGTVTVSGHTDNKPIKTRKFRSNFELSSKRSYSVLKELLYQDFLTPERFVIDGMGPIQPMVSNKSAKGEIPTDVSRLSSIRPTSAISTVNFKRTKISRTRIRRVPSPLNLGRKKRKAKKTARRAIKSAAIEVVYHRLRRSPRPS